MHDESFFMVWNPNGRPPMYRHMTRNAAITEAERLARENTGAQFFVLQAIEMRMVDGMQRVTLEDCPF